MSNAQPPRCKNLVLDAGPLLSLSPLRGLATTYLTVPQVLTELKDQRAREHFERLGLSSGVKIEVRSPDASSLAHVIQWAKKTGDYAVLSHADICVLALTYYLHEREKDEARRHVEAVQPTDSALQITNTNTTEDINREVSKDITGKDSSEDVNEPDEEDVDGAEEEPDGLFGEENEGDEQDLEPLGVELQPLNLKHEIPSTTSKPTEPQESSQTPPSQLNLNTHPTPLYDDPSDSDDGEGEWITPSNVSLHKSRALDLLPMASAKGKGKPDEVIGAGCMTADFAMQNVLLQMGLSLVGVEGQRIEKVKSWVLRCHACFKICKDASKKFCPSCGNPTLLRASVTIATPTASPNAPAMQVHLKPNFQYKTRGTKYSIPAPKPGSAKKGSGEGLILREDQVEYMRAKKRAEGKREREEAKMTKGIFGRGAEGGIGAVGVGSWMDPDWVPEIISVGAGGKGRSVRSSGMDGDMPVIGYGKKNPNERKKRK